MFSFLPLVLIFLSLAVIVYIIGRKIPQLRELGKQKNQTVKIEREGKTRTGSFLGAIFSNVGKIFVFIAEWLVKKAKKMLHLVHFWLIKMKKGKQENEMVGEMEAKQELIMEEEKNLERIINEDLAQAEEDQVRVHQEPEPLASKPIDSPKPPLTVFKEENTQDAKLKQFFSEDKESLEAEKAKGRFFQRFWKKKSAQTTSPEDLENTSFSEEADQLLVSDGIRKISKGSSYVGKEAVDERLMKEVVSVKRRDEVADLDDELGVDRRILEKKIIQKITRNPRDAENYRQLGELYIKMKNFADAEESYKQILKIVPRDIDAKRKLEKIKLLKRLS